LKIHGSELEVAKFMRANSQRVRLSLGQVEVVLLEVASPLSLYVTAVSVLPTITDLGE